MELEFVIRDERSDFSELVAGLARHEWDLPSLCRDWSVRDVVGHVLANDEVGMVGYMRGLAVSRLSTRRYAERLRSDWAQRPIESIVASATDLAAPRRMARSMLHWAPFVLLTETFIHQQDIRRAVGWGREVDEERMVAVLTAMVSTGAGVHARRHAAGLRLRAQDADFEHGEGPEVAGPAEVLVMALAGRGVALGELEGEGLRVLIERTSGEAVRVSERHRGGHAERRSALDGVRQRLDAGASTLRGRLARRRNVDPLGVVPSDDDTAERMPAGV